MLFHPVYTLFNLLNLIISIASCIAVAILGIVIVTRKNRSTKVLGIGFIVTFMLSLVTVVLQRAAVNVTSVHVFSTLSSISNITGFASTLFFNLFIAKFLQRNYGKKYIYIPLLLIPLVGRVCSILTTSILNRMALPTGSLGPAVSLINSCSSFLSELVVDIIIIAVFAANRKKEPVIPMTWIIRIIVLCFNSIPYVYMSSCYMISFLNSLNGENVFYPDGVLSLILMSVNSLISLIFPIYVLAKAAKADRAEQERYEM